MEILESMLRRLANDLLGKVWHQNVILRLILNHEVLEVIRGAFLAIRGAQGALKHVVGVHYRDARDILSGDLDRHAK